MTARCSDLCPWDTDLRCDRMAGHTVPDPRYPRAAHHQVGDTRWTDACHFDGDDCGPGAHPKETR